jgi:mono/diheme cytochrome c family protein
MQIERTKSISIGPILIVASLMAIAAPAIGDEAGKNEFMNACAACHGVEGKGKGPMSELLTVIPPSLTGLAAANEGVFPMQEVVAIIDGRTDVRAHGSGMPVWGAVFQDPTAGEVTGKSPDYIARGRILSLAYYLESIQE